jgi:phosphoglycerate kinase
MSLSVKKPEDVQEIGAEELLSPGQNDEYSAVDIGPNTIKQYMQVIKDSKTIFWNGNMGISEVPEFANGTNSIAQAIISSDAEVVIGGGDTVAAVEALGIESNDKIFLSTGGGATLEFLAGKELPGLKVLE